MWGTRPSFLAHCFSSVMTSSFVSDFLSCVCLVMFSSKKKATPSGCDPWRGSVLVFEKLLLVQLSDRTGLLARKGPAISPIAQIFHKIIVSIGFKWVCRASLRIKRAVARPATNPLPTY